MMINEQAYSDLAVPPGEFLEEVIAGLGMTKVELARRMNRPAPKLSAIFTGEKAITADTALQLEKVVGVPAHIWSGLESEYRLALARQLASREQDKRKAETPLVTKFCYKELLKRGFVEPKTQPAEKVRELQRFLGVTSLHSVLKLRKYEAVAFRHGAGNRQRSPEAVVAWLRIGEVTAQRTECPPFTKQALRHALIKMRKMTKQTPEQFREDLEQILRSCGVVLVLAPHLPKTYANGATFWLGNDKAVLMLTIRGGWADIFWFSLFHELGHLLLHGRQNIFLEKSQVNDKMARLEDEADRFAANTLISAKDYRGFVRAGSFREADIRVFAKTLEIDPGVVVGRLQHDGYLDNSWHNRLRWRYVWKNG